MAHAEHQGDWMICCRVVFSKVMKATLLYLLMLSLGLIGCGLVKGESSVASQALYERLVALEQHDGWRILVCDAARISYLDFPKHPPGSRRPSLAPAGSSPENLRRVKIVEQIVRPGAIATESYSNVYRYSVKDRQAVPIFGIGDTYYDVADATFAPDGQRIALWVRTPESEKTDRSQLVLLDSEGHFQETLLEASHVGRIAWSSDGTRLAFVANYQQMEDRFISNTQVHPLQGALFVFDLATKTQREVIESGVHGITSYAWSPGDREIVYEGIDDDILIYNFDTHQSRTLIAKGLAEGFPTWSPSGEWIAYMGTDRNYYRIHPDGSGQELLLENFKSSWRDWFSWEAWTHPVTEIWGPLIWAPDSQYLLYGRHAGQVGLQTMLHVLDLKTRHTVRLGEFDGDSPLGSWVRTM